MVLHGSGTIIYIIINDYMLTIITKVLKILKYGVTWQQYVNGLENIHNNKYDKYETVNNILKLCHMKKNWITIASLHMRSLFAVAKDISRVLKCLQMTEISMSSANCLEIEAVTLLVLYFLSSDVTILITDIGEKWPCKT